ncbi:MAG TPA: putative zinc-binding protein [Candidatus Hydrogenedens sp.]|nr:putative zinc-binding protein [Candidatus Hydrogenedens sp.]
MQCNCSNEEGVTLIYSCSGVANTGLIADRVMRNLVREKVCRGSCLSGVASDASGFIQSALAANKNVVIDGCSVACGKKIFEKREIPFEHIVITDLGVEKGKTIVTDELVQQMTEVIKEKIQK